MKKIFISRSLNPSSPIRNIARDHVLVDQSLIEFSPIDFEEPRADWIFFYSRNGVKYFFEGGNYALYPYLWACMSEGTADELSHYVTDISFIGNGSPEDVTLKYVDHIKPTEVTCFIRAEHSLDSINKNIENDSNFSIPVYHNTPTQSIPTQKFDIIIFTSPMNVDAWFKKRAYNNECLISIGNTTAKHLEKYGIKDVIVSRQPSEEAIAKSLQALL